MIIRKAAAKTKAIPGTARGASPIPNNFVELTKIAKSLLANKSVPSSAAIQADVTSMVYLFTDYPELLNSLGAPSPAAKKALAKPATGAYSPEQIVSMARYHFTVKAASASADHLLREIDRILSEQGRF
jgi:hypothetical protein